jgi:hypothetical protein
VVIGRARVAALIAPLAVSVVFGACGDDAQVWKGDSGRSEEKAVSVAPAATSVPDEPARATNPADAPSPGGTNPDGSSFGTTDTQPKDAAVKQDLATMLLLRTAMSTIEGCHSGRASYSDCDEQRELGARDELGIVFGTEPGAVKVSASPKSVRLTGRSESGARFTVARSLKGDRFSCQPGPAGGGACPDTRTWAW